MIKRKPYNNEEIENAYQDTLEDYIDTHPVSETKFWKGVLFFNLLGMLGYKVDSEEKKARDRNAIVEAEQAAYDAAEEFHATTPLPPEEWAELARNKKRAEYCNHHTPERNNGSYAAGTGMSMIAILGIIGFPFLASTMGLAALIVLGAVCIIGLPLSGLLYDQHKDHNVLKKAIEEGEKAYEKEFIKRTEEKQRAPSSAPEHTTTQLSNNKTLSKISFVEKHLQQQASNEQVQSLS